MNEIPRDDPSPDDVDDLYRRAAARDPSRPAEPTRRAILDHAARLAAERAAQARPIELETAPRAPQRRWRPALIGTLAAALFAGLIVAPRLWTPPARRQSDLPQTSALVHTPPLPWDASAPKAEYAPAPAPAPAPPPLSEAAPTSGGARSAVVAEPPAAKSSPSAAASQSAQQAREVLADTVSPTTGLSRARQAVDAPATLRRAAQAGDLLALKKTLGQPVDVNARDASGQTALMLAILNGQGAAVDALLANGADPNVADATGTTPLAAALSRGDPAIVSALQRAGARATASAIERPR